jgi:phage major head subunit gpT-like protein
MIINQTSLQTLFTGFKANFQQGLSQHKAQWDRVATRVNSGTRTDEYGWLGQMPNLREWLGDRVVNSIKQHGYSITNRKFELTIGVEVDDIKDDMHGVYAPLFTEMGRSTAAHPDQLVWNLLTAGFSTACYDGQYFFDSDHPVILADGSEGVVANTDGGSGTPWFLIDTNRALKPIIYQVREEGPFVRIDRDTDEVVFNTDKYVYGIKRRSNVGFGFWQFAWGSKQTLSATTYKLARESLMGMKGDHGRPLGLMPNLLVVPPSLESQGLELLNAERNAAGATNIYKGTAELLVVPWLA